jgi:hypothetical protein
MKLLFAAILVLSLSACGHNMDGHMDQYNPLGGDITAITPSAQDANMVVIQVEIKRLVNEQGIKDQYLYWVINGAQKKDNMAVYDITITVSNLRARYIFGLTDGVLEMVKQVEVDAEVNCQHESEQYEGRDQA